MSPVSPFEKLKTYYFQLLPSLNEESWKFCQSLLQVRQLKKGEMILKEGTVCNYVSFVNSGLVRIYYMVDGREKIQCFHDENGYVSDYPSFLTREPATVNIQAIEDTELVETNYDDLQLLYKVAPEANRLGRLIAEQLFINMNENRALEMKYTIEEAYNKLVDEKPWLIQKVPQYMIASYLGITPEALSRVKSRISKTKKVLARY